MTLDAFLPTPGRVLTVAQGRYPFLIQCGNHPYVTVMSVCPVVTRDSRGGPDGGSQERKAQEGQASHLEMSFPGTVLSGLSDGWGSPWA